MAGYTLLTDGDAFEKKCWNLFIKEEFQNYEKFWVQFVVPLTNRPNNIHFKAKTELDELGKTDKDVCIAQLSYSVLRHLSRAYELIRLLKDNSFSNLSTTTPESSATSSDSSAFSSIGTGHTVNIKQSPIDVLTEGMMRICGAQDVAFELLERIQNKNLYDAWDRKHSETACKAWQNHNKRGQKSNSLNKFRYYRNHLVHGRLSPSVNAHHFPAIGKEQNYLDWRMVTQTTPESEDFQDVKSILEQAWKETLTYLNDKWQPLISQP